MNRKILNHKLRLKGSSIVYCEPKLSLSILLIISFLAGCKHGVTSTVDSTQLPPSEKSPTVSSGIESSSIPQETLQLNTPSVSPYVVVDISEVDVRYLDTNPVQIELIIRGQLPDQCQYEFYSVENRQENVIKITLKGIHPADSCEQSSQEIVHILLLGRDMAEANRGFKPGDYILIVNGYQIGFSIEE